jgi:hypothetical protein
MARWRLYPDLRMIVRFKKPVMTTLISVVVLLALVYVSPRMFVASVEGICLALGRLGQLVLGGLQVG